MKVIQNPTGQNKEIEKKKTIVQDKEQREKENKIRKHSLLK